MESLIDYDYLESVKQELKCSFQNSGQSLRYFVHDRFLKGGAVNELAESYPEVMARAGKNPNDPKKHRHVLKKIGVHRPEIMNECHRQFFEEIQQPRFLEILSEITGIVPLYADVDLEGGGLHEIYRGGYLNVHTDFNIHPKKGWHRKLNIIFYLNPIWKDEWEGHLELWNEAVDTMVTRIAPVGNRLAIFETSEISFHGHPTPLNSPENITRRSLATYYYTDWPAGLEPRVKTNYRLVPWQVQEVQSRIKQLKSQGLADEKIIEALKLQYQEADLKRQLRDSYK